MTPLTFADAGAGPSRAPGSDVRERGYCLPAPHTRSVRALQATMTERPGLPDEAVVAGGSAGCDE